jgi:hypothetical protein
MITRNLSFELEKNLPATFLLQGWCGGIVAGFVYTVAICLWEPSFKFLDAVAIAPYLAVAGSFVGVIKATIMWAPYILTKIQVRALTRVVLTTIGTGLFGVLAVLKFGYGYERPSNTAAWVLVLLFGGLPTAIMVGSRIKPWELFTFGSIAIGDSRTKKRVGSNNILATLGTLPLRFLSLIALALWILTFSCEPGMKKWWTLDVILFFLIPVAYLLFSAYVTFKSPHKILLLLSGLAANVPVALISFFAYEIYSRGSWLGKAPLYVSGICAAFVIAWVIFLAARLSVPTHSAMPTSRLREALKSGGAQVDHECLGSRFLEWQEHRA